VATGPVKAAVARYLPVFDRGMRPKRKCIVIGVRGGTSDALRRFNVNYRPIHVWNDAKVCGCKRLCMANNGKKVTP